MSSTHHTPHGVMFHYFHDAMTHPRSQGSITAGEFEGILRFLKDRFHLLSADRWYDKAMHHQLRARDICMTFDDNLRCQFDIALPVLESLHLKAFWFINTAPLCGHMIKLELYRYYRTVAFDDVAAFYRAFHECLNHSPYAQEVHDAIQPFDTDRYLEQYSFYTREDRWFRYIRDRVLKSQRYEEIMDAMISRSQMDGQALRTRLWNDRPRLQEVHRRGHLLGLHSHTHPTNLAELSVQAQQEEYLTNYQTLKQVTQAEITSMSHPNNSYSKTTLRILHGMGIRVGFRDTMTSSGRSPLEFPRLDHAHLLQEVRV